jgi:hypothetical protein
MVVSGGRAWWFYFGGQRVGNINWAVIPGDEPFADNPAPAPATNTLASASTNAPAPGRFGSRGISINVVELKVVDGKLMFTNPNLPTYVDLKPDREKKYDVPMTVTNN